MTYQQYRAVRRLVHSCCNYQEGNCLLLDDGEECICPQAISYSLICRWFRAAVLPLDESLCAVLLHREDMKKCVLYCPLIHNTPPVVMNLKKIRRLMKKYGLQCPIRRANPYRKMKNAMKTNHYAPILLDREFESYGPRLVLLTDITYIPWGGSFLYLCVIMDAYTKQVLSYTLSPSLDVDFVLDAVDILMREHGVSLHAETVIHSDQGCHYTSCKFIELVEHNELRRSMSRKGNCWDNAPQESFFGHMKDLIDLTGDPSFDEVKAIIDDYMSYYNNERYQWDLAKLSPNEYFSFVTTGIYPLDLPSKPSPPEISKTPYELGAHTLEPEIVSDPLIR